MQEGKGVSLVIQFFFELDSWQFEIRKMKKSYMVSTTVPGTRDWYML